MKKDKPDKPTVTPTARKKPKQPEKLSPEENQNFINHINEYLLKKENQKKETNYNYEYLYNNVSEYLESFVVFGYTYNGERILIQHATNSRDRDALLEFLKNIFISFSKDTLVSDKETDE